jgi:hypothetical protein
MQNINPNIWGTHGWTFMHYITLAYPENPSEEDKKNIKTYFTNVGKILPCYSCRLNYKKHLHKRPLTSMVVSNEKNLSKWLVDIHNDINEEYGKRKYTMEEFYDEYLGSHNKYSYTNYILIIGLVILIIIFFMKRFI